jgi:hypothetical protein
MIRSQTGRGQPSTELHTRQEGSSECRPCQCGRQGKGVRSGTLSQEEYALAVGEPESGRDVRNLRCDPRSDIPHTKMRELHDFFCHRR